MKTIKSLLLITFVIISTTLSANSTVWPKEIKTSAAKITVYQPQPLSFKNNKLECMAAVSIVESGKSDPVFGSFWAEGMMSTNRDTRVVSLESLNINNIKFPGITDANLIKKYASLIENDAARWDLDMALDDLLATLESNQTEQNLSEKLSVDPPSIIFKNKYSVLVTIDGEPIWQKDNATGFDRVVNTPFTIIKQSYSLYLYGGGFWYSASRLDGPWSPMTSVPKSLSAIDKAMKKSEKENDVVNPTVPAQIVISYEPAELIQSNGKAEFAPLEGTGLLYITNSDDAIFMHIDSQKYFVLISGRWYRAGNLSGPWEYTAADALPSDFAQIPADSDMSDVLASVAGTEEAREAVLDAQIPQTAKVDRNSARATVEYDGNPRFEAVDGTQMSYAVNTSSSVIKAEGMYYVVEDGVWFVSSNPNGPWEVATMRPQAVSQIPPSSPVYNVKYVYIYDVTPQYVYMGYTPGYLGTYIYGPVVVYGTGYHYRPWYGSYYYARPYTWGFNMRYNPWTGWSINLGYSFSWFHFDVWGHHHYRPGWCGGWWGPPVYRPPYHVHRPPHHPYPGHGNRPSDHYYGRNPHTKDINRHHTNNIYNHRGDVITQTKPSRPIYGGNSSRPGPSVSNRPGTRPTTPEAVKPGTRPAVRPETRPGTSGQTRPTTRPESRPGNSEQTRPSTRPTTRPAGNSRPVSKEGTTTNRAPRPSVSRESVTVDREGNVYQRNKEGNVQQYNGRNWENVNRNSSNQQNVNRQIEQRQRGNTNASVKYQNTQRGGNVGSSYSKPRATNTPKATAPAARQAFPKRQQPAARQAHSNSSTRRTH